MTLVLLLACADGVGSDTAAGHDSADTGGGGDTADTGGDTDTADTGDTDTADTADTGDSGDPPLTGPLDDCAAASRPLAEQWSLDLTGAAAAPTQLAWAGGLLVVRDGASLVGLDLPDQPTAPALSPRWTAAAPAGTWSAVRFGGGALVATAGTDFVVVDEASGATTSTASGAAAPLLGLAESPGGVRAWTADEVVAFAPASTTVTHPTAPALLPLVQLGGSPTSAFAAGFADPSILLGAAVAPDYAEYTTDGSAIAAFGRPVAVVATPDGGATVLGGPEGYAWAVTLAADGTVGDTLQLESPGIHAGAGSPGSAYAWTFMDGFGVTAFTGTTYAFVSGTIDGVDLWVDPTGTWLLTLEGDGTLRRWVCEAP